MIDSLSVGGLYALAALGIGLIFGIMRLINFAYGDLLMMGAYAMFLLAAAVWPITILGGVVIAILVALVTERIAFRPLRTADPSVLLAASFAPTGQAKWVGSDIEVSGRWSFASACDASSWMMVGAMLPSDGGAPDLRMFLVPNQDYRIDDNWHVSGLAGTGSKDIVIDGAMVPEYRSLSLPGAMAGHSPGRELYSDSPLYRVPFGTMLLFALAGPALGMARGAYATFLERARTRLITYSAEKQSDQTPTQILLGEASYRLDAVELLWERDLTEIAERTRENRDFSIEERARYKRDVGQGLRTCQQVVAELSAASGAHGIFRSNPIQRAFRDTHAMTTHAALDPSQSACAIGRIELGLDPATVLI